MIPLFKVFMSPKINEKVIEVLHSGNVTQGEKVEEFESKLKEHFNYPYILTLNSATSGLTLGLRLLNLQNGDEVLTSPLTCTATNWPILVNNLNIKWVDVDSRTCNMNLDDLKNKISEKTKVLLLIHWAGIPNDLYEINKILDEKEKEFGFRIQIVEDCAHAFGSKYDNKFIGTHGNIAVFSLQAIKHLTAVDGGLIFLPNEELYRRAKLLRWFGIDREVRSRGDFRMEPDIPEWGYKFHMNNLNASIGMENLNYVDKNIQKIIYNADYYNKHLSNLKNIQLLEVNNLSKPSWWIYTIKVRNRDHFISFAKSKNIMVSQVHKRNDYHSCVKDYKSYLPLLDELEKEYVSIPVGWWLTEFDLEKIVKMIKDWNIICDCNIRLLNENDYNLEFLNLFKQLNGVEIQLTHEEFKNKLKLQENQNSFTYVLEYNNKIITTAKIIIEEKFYENVAHIEDVICDKEFRRHGLASYLLNRIIEIYKSKVYKIILSSKECNKSFYESLGFFTDSFEYKIYSK